MYLGISQKMPLYNIEERPTGHMANLLSRFRPFLSSGHKKGVESLVAGRVERFIQASPHKRKLISRHRILLLSSPLPEFHSPLVASPTTHNKYLPPLPFAIGRSIHEYIYRRASGLAAESVCSFTFTTRTVLDRANTLISSPLFTHPPTCLQSPLLRTI